MSSVAALATGAGAGVGLAAQGVRHRRIGSRLIGSGSLKFFADQAAMASRGAENEGRASTSSVSSPGGTGTRAFAKRINRSADRRAGMRREGKSRRPKQRASHQQNVGAATPHTPGPLCLPWHAAAWPSARAESTQQGRCWAGPAAVRLPQLPRRRQQRTQRCRCAPDFPTFSALVFGLRSMHLSSRKNMAAGAGCSSWVQRLAACTLDPHIRVARATHVPGRRNNIAVLVGCAIGRRAAAAAPRAGVASQPCPTHPPSIASSSPLCTRQFQHHLTPPPRPLVLPCCPSGMNAAEVRSNVSRTMSTAAQERALRRLRWEYLLGMCRHLCLYCLTGLSLPLLTHPSLLRIFCIFGSDADVRCWAVASLLPASSHL